MKCDRFEIDRVERVEFFSRVEHKEHRDRFGMFGKLMVAVCAAVLCWGAFAVEVTAAAFPDADVVVVDEIEKVAYKADGTYVDESETWTKILTERGRRDESVVTIGYNARYGTAAIVAVDVKGTNGEERVIDFAATMKETTDNSSMGSNIVDPLDRKIVCTIPGLQIGETVHVKIRREATKSRIQDQWSDVAVMEWTHPILRGVYEVTAPAERPIRSKAVRHALGNVVASEVTNANGTVVHRFEARNVPRMFPEPEMPPMWTEVQNVRLSTAADWREISTWYWKLCEPHLACTTEAMTNKVKEIGKDVRAIFKFVSQEVRYMGLTMEDVSPGYAPHDVNVTFENRYGVCRDKAGLLVAMLRIAGFKAFPVLINVGAKMDPDVPQPYFNHAIVAVDQGERDYLLMDPTNENTKDLFPSYLCAKSYLVARPEGEELKTSSVPAPEENAVVAKSTARLGKDGAMVLESAIQFSGIHDTAYRGSLVRRTAEERQAFFEKRVQAMAGGAELVKCEILPRDLRDTEKPLEVKIVAKLPEMVLRGRTEDGLNVPLMGRALGLVERLLDGNALLEKRKYPLVMDVTAQVVDELSIELGDAVGEVRTLPEDVVVTGGYEYERVFGLTNGVLRVRRVQALGTVEFSPEEYAALREDLKKVEAAERRRPIFAADETKGADVHRWLEATEIDIGAVDAWVVTNEVVKEVLTYKGKKGAAEMKFAFNPTWKNVEVLSATVSNRDGRVWAVKPGEMNVMDCGWASAAPRYPAGKLLVVNLPSVEVGSVISVKTATTVTNAPAPFYGTFYFDSYEPLDRRVVRVNGWRREVVLPRRLADEPMQPAGTLWRDCEIISSNDFHLAAAVLRRAADVKAVDEMAGKSAEEIRNWLHRAVRVVGPSLYEVPIERQLTASEIVLKERYATRLDYVRTLCALLRGAGYEADIVFAAAGSEDEPQAIRERDMFGKPNVRAFASALCRVRERVGGFLGIGGEVREMFIGTENEYVPLGATSFDGCDYFDPVTEEFGIVKASAADFCAKECDTMAIQVRENGAADVDVKETMWGAGVGSFRKEQTEILPEDRSRLHQSLLGTISQAATATSDLKTDVTGYPATMEFSCYVPDYATREGDVLTLTVPAFTDRLFPLTGSTRTTPLRIAAETDEETIVRVTFPAGFTTIEHLPESFQLCDPVTGAVWCENKVTTSTTADGALVVTITRTTPRRVRSQLDSTYFQLLKDWTRLGASRANRTISVRRAAQ